MSIEWYRDLSITFMGLGGTLTFIFIGVLAFYIYREVKVISHSVRAASKSVQETVDVVRTEIVTPVVTLANLIQWIKAFIEGFMKSIHKPESEGGNKSAR